MRIGIVAPSCPIDQELAERVRAIAAVEAPDAALLFHPQCFLSSGHFAGTDAQRASAFLEVANDPEIDAIWFARGGYGACRIAEDVLTGMSPAALAKTYLGYSDAGFLLAGLYKSGARIAHGPMPRDAVRDGGEAAVARTLAWITRDSPDAIEPSCRDGAPMAAFNLTVLSHLLGTPLQPDLSGHVLMIEDVAEHHYRLDRAMFHLTASPAMRHLAGIKLGRVSDIPDNDPDFGQDEETIVRHWCSRAGIPYLGRADIGHDAENKIVPFGRSR
jgi:muramoyltetrapeptide carboxypeptidase